MSFVGSISLGFMRPHLSQLDGTDFELSYFFLIMLVEMTLEAIFWNTKGFSSLEGGDILDISALCVLQP